MGMRSPPRRPGGGGGGGGGGGAATGTGFANVTMIADTLPTSPSIIAFPVSVSSLVFTPSSGTPQTVTLNPPVIVDLARVQSDTAFLGTFASLPTAQYTSITAVMGLPSQITVFNDSGAAITKVNSTSLATACPNNAVCEFTVSATGSQQASMSLNVSSTAGTSVELDVNLSNIVSLSAGNLSVSFGNANTLTAFALPRAGGSNLAAGGVDVIEDITGVVSITSSGVTITPASATGRHSVTASTNSGMILDADPSGTVCTNPTPGTISSCLSNNQAASMDVLLKSDGTLTVQEIEPLLGTLQDTVEGTVVAIGGQTQFSIVTSDLLPAATNSHIGTLHIGDPLTVNIAANPNPFLVDTKGLPIESVAPGTLANFQGATDTTALRLGQTVAIHVVSFTAGTTPIASTDTITLRWSRFTATPVQPFTDTSFNISGFPSYFQASGTAEAQAFPAPITTQNITNIDGVTGAASILTTKLIAVRVLFIENSTNTAEPAFVAAKIRQH